VIGMSGLSLAKHRHGLVVYSQGCSHLGIMFSNKALR
jgi:hypothetical protein